MAPCVIAALIIAAAVCVLAVAIVLKDPLTLLVCILVLWWWAHRVRRARTLEARPVLANGGPRTQHAVFQDRGAIHGPIDEKRSGLEAESGPTSAQT